MSTVSNFKITHENIIGAFEGARAELSSFKQLIPSGSSAAQLHGKLGSVLGIIEYGLEQTVKLTPNEANADKLAEYKAKIAEYKAKIAELQTNLKQIGNIVVGRSAPQSISDGDDVCATFPDPIVELDEMAEPVAVAVARPASISPARTTKGANYAAVAKGSPSNRFPKSSAQQVVHAKPAEEKEKDAGASASASATARKPTRDVYMRTSITTPEALHDAVRKARELSAGKKKFDLEALCSAIEAAGLQDTLAGIMIANLDNDPNFIGIPRMTKAMRALGYIRRIALSLADTTKSEAIDMHYNLYANGRVDEHYKQISLITGEKRSPCFVENFTGYINRLMNADDSDTVLSFTKYGNGQENSFTHCNGFLTLVKQLVEISIATGTNLTEILSACDAPTQVRSSE